MNAPRPRVSTQAHYAQLAEVYAERANVHANERYRLECLEWIKPCRKILDVGCGTTNLIAELRRDLQKDVFGIDASVAMLAQSPGRGCVAGSLAEQLPFGDNTFDGVLSINLLEHVAEPRRVLQELVRVLRVGGRLALATPAAECSAFLDLAERLRLKIPEGPHRFLRRQELLEFAAATGFRAVTCRQILILPIGGKRLARAMYSIERRMPSIGLIHWLVAERDR